MDKLGLIILAGGLSTRMGQPKALLPWINGESLISHALRKGLDADIQDIRLDCVKTYYYSSLFIYFCQLCFLCLCSNYRSLFYVFDFTRQGVLLLNILLHHGF